MTHNPQFLNLDLRTPSFQTRLMPPPKLLCPSVSLSLRLSNSSSYSTSLE